MGIYKHKIINVYIYMATSNSDYLVVLDNVCTIKAYDKNGNARAIHDGIDYLYHYADVINITFLNTDLVFYLTTSIDIPVS